MTDQKEIDLLVRANIKGKKDLESVAKSIDSISEALDKQSAAAKRGENSLDELKASMAALEIEKSKLSDNQKLLNGFQALSDRLTKTEERANKAAAAYQKYKDELDGLSQVTDKQQDRLIKLSNASERATARLDEQRKQQLTLSKALAEAGLSTDDLAGSQAKLTTAYAQYATVFSKAQSAITSYTQDVRTAREAEKALVAENTFQKKLQDAAQLNKANDYVQFWTKSLNDADKVQQELDANRALSKLATDAEKSAQSFTTLATASSNLRPNVTSLRDAVNGILNPGQELRKTLGGVEDEVGSLSRTIGSIRGPVEDAAGKMKQLEAASKAIGRQSGLVDDVQRQTAAFRAARAEFVNIRSQVLQYAEAVRQGGANTQANTRALAEAEGRLRGAATALNTQLNALRASRQALREAGIETGNLSGAQERLKNAASSVVSSMRGLNTAVDEYGNAASRSNSGGGILGRDEGRTTLSFIQRLRGELLSLVAAYGGLYSAINLTKGSLDAFSSREGARNQLSLSVGNSKEAIDEEYAYVKAQSDRIGIEFERAIKGYAKFSAAASMAGRSRQEIRYIFEAFSEVSKVANISAEDLDGVFKALEQITSKGKIQAEELRGQLGDRLFGAFQVAAKALKDQFPDLDKALQNGVVTSEQLVLIAEEYRKTVADQLPAAMKSMTAEQARMNNAMREFKLAVADSGFAEKYVEAIKKVTDFLNSADGKEAAVGFGQALSKIADGFIWLIENSDTVITVLQAIGVYFASKAILGWLDSLRMVTAALPAFATRAGQAAAALKGFAAAWPVLTTAITTALGVLGAAFAGFQIGTWMYEQSQTVRKFGVALVTGFAEMTARIKFAWNVLWDNFPAVAANILKVIYNNTIVPFVKKTLGIFGTLASALGFDQLASSVLQASNSLTLGYADISAAVADRRKQLQTELDRIREIGMDMWKQAEVDPRAAAAAAVQPSATNTLGQPSPLPAIRPTKPKGADKDAEAAARKLESLINEAKSAINALEVKTDRSQTDSLKAQQNAVTQRYEPLRQKLMAMGGEAGREYLKALDEAIATYNKSLADNFNKGIAEDFTALNAELARVSAAVGKKEVQDLVARQKAIEDSYQGMYDRIAAMRAKLVLNNLDAGQADAAKVRLDSYVQELKDLEAVKFAKEELERREARMNELLKLREAQVAAVNAQKEAGAIKEAEAATRINQINVDSLPGITAAGEATRVWAEANRAIFASDADFQTYLANLEAVRAKAATVKTQYTDMQIAVGRGIEGGIENGLNATYDNLLKVAQGQQTVEQGFRNILASFAQFAAQFLKDIALMIAKTIILNSLPGGSAVATAASAGVRHSGGVIGSYGAGNRTRNVSAAWFANAPRYHTGGVMGLKPDEYPTILQRGEEVLAADSPRNIMNGGGLAPSKGGDASGMRVVLVDDRAKVHEAMTSSEGEKVIVQAIRRNIPSIKQMMRG